MAKAIETLSIKLEFKDPGTQQIIKKLESSLKGMTRVVAGDTSPAINKLRREILEVGKAGTQSISNFKSQATALRALRDEARVGSDTFKKLTEDIKKLDAQMGKTAKTTAGRGGARQATQIAGAVVSGGIFGGPEGALGALGGAALGGVEGAFAGAAIGAQLKGLRDLLSGASEYAAQVEKLDIALKGVAGTQDEYSSAIAAAREVTESFNVPQLDAVRGVTRLTAAVKGAGGPIGDAEKTFKNVTAAIKATGGSTEDVRGAITAMVQVFSKGKVSAEELSGQLGERLPGAVTMFAKANKMTLPQLQENLKAGTVGLNELMRFIEELGRTYSGTASDIADSNAEAGARLAVAVQDMQASVGAALVPIGAQFQEAFSDFVRTITPFLTQNLPKLGKLFLALAKNIDTFAVSAVAALAVFAPVKIAAIIASIGGIGKALVLLKAKLIAVGLANPFTAIALAVGVLAGKLYTASKEQARFNKLVKEGTVPQVDAEISLKRKQLDEQIKRRLALDPTGEGAAPQQRVFQEGGSEYLKEQRLRDDLEALKERRRTAVIDQTQGAGLDPSLFKPFDYKTPAEEDDSTGGSSKEATALANRVKAAQALERSQLARLNLAQSEGKISSLLAKQLNQRGKLSDKIAELQRKGTNAEIDNAIASAQTNQKKAEQKELQKAIDGLYQQAKGPIDNIVKGVQDKVRFEKQHKELIAQGINPEIATQIVNITRAKEAGLAKLDAELLSLEASKLETGLSEEQLRIIEEQIDAIKRKKEALEGEAAKATGTVKDTQEETTFMEGLTEAIKNQEEALKNLVDPLQQVIGFANAMGESFKASFKGLIDGTMNGKEALSSFFKSMSDYFMDMAAEIAAAAIKLAALKFVEFIIGAFAGSGGGGGGSYSIPDAAVPKTSGIKFFSKGGVIGEKKIVPYAKGGIVNKPTLFEYASGGSGNFGLMGEAGPEAILPLRRGRNGKLGVESAGGIGDIVVNVDASGSSVEGQEDESRQLGKLIGAAVQSELIKQKRPGGLLS